MKFLFGIVSSIITFCLIFFFFPLVFKETPVNLLHIGGRNGFDNVMFSIIIYALASYFGPSIIHKYVLRKNDWYFEYGLRAGIVISFIILFGFMFIYFI